MSAIKKLFSRKKDKEPERGRGGSSVNTDTLRASAYDSVSPGGAPQTGAYPIKGNASSPSVAGRQTSTARSRAPSASRHNVRKSEIPMSMKAVPPHTENRPRSSPGFKNESAPAVRHSSANQNTDHGFAPTHRNVSNHQNNDVAPSFHNRYANHNTDAETSRPLENTNNNNSAMHNYNSYQNQPPNFNYEPRAVNAGMSPHISNGRDDVAPGTALTTDDGNASELPLHSTMSSNRNMESNCT